jgi:hypothetical protein
VANVNGIDFDADAFRDGVHIAMVMGTPSATPPTFHFKKTTSYPVGTRLDNEGQPFDLTVQPTITEPTPVQVPVALEFKGREGNDSPVGVFRDSDVILTILDRDYVRVEDAVEVELGGDRYILTYREPPLAVFNVTIHRIHGRAKDET